LQLLQRGMRSCESMCRTSTAVARIPVAKDVLTDAADTYGA
jgi:hypothetical protein